MDGGCAAVLLKTVCREVAFTAKSGEGRGGASAVGSDGPHAQAAMGRRATNAIIAAAARPFAANGRSLRVHRGCALCCYAASLSLRLCLRRREEGRGLGLVLQPVPLNILIFRLVAVRVRR